MLTRQEYMADVLGRCRFDATDWRGSCLGLLGEYGEVVDLVKKIVYHAPTHERLTQLAEECVLEFGDVLWYAHVEFARIGSVSDLQADWSVLGTGLSGSAKARSLYWRGESQQIADQAFEGAKKFVLYTCGSGSTLVQLREALRSLDRLGCMLESFFLSHAVPVDLHFERCARANMLKLAQRGQSIR